MMALTEKRIAALEAKGFSRWTKGNYDRLYINAGALGLHCDYYKTGNISDATFQGNWISNSEARRMKAAKTFIDIKTGEVHSDNYTLEKAVKAIIEELDELDEQEVAEAAQEAETVTEQETADNKEEKTLKINICTIDRNCEEGRQTIYWDSEDKLLHSELNPEDENGYPCETLEAAADMAWMLWGNGWGFEWANYSIKPEYLDQWSTGGGPYENVTLNARDIGAICRGWETDPVEIMYQLDEVPTVKYYVELIDTRYMIKDIETRDTVYTGLLADAGITEDLDPEYTNKLDNYFQSEYGILPEEWEVN